MSEIVSMITSPIQVNGISVKNRVVVPPMADFGMTEKNGFANERHAQHYGAYAAGGTGLIIIEACAVSIIKEERNTIALFDDSCIQGMSRLAEKATANGTVSLVQLLNPGIPFIPEKKLEQISREKFQSYKADYVSAALRCQKAGFHGVDLHAAHGFYLNQIVETSNRSDEYGGCFNNRVRIIQELIAEIKKACGKDFIVSIRFGNRSLSDLVNTAIAIEEAGGDLLNVSTGLSGYHEIPQGFPHDSKIYAASLVKKSVNTPVICVGNIATGKQAKQILGEGLADMIAVGRGHLCDPAWANKVIAGEAPNPCKHCRSCLWYIDGRRCPALR